MIHTETATVVFTDIVQSTELATQLSFDAYDALRRAHFDLLRLAISVHRGREIKTNGDGLAVAFTSASDAAACMMKMQQMVVRAAQRQGGKPRVRIGASSGEVSYQDDDIFGIAVVEAARLCAAAAPDQILVSDLIRSLTRGLSYEFVPAGDFLLKGLPQPVTAYTLNWQRGEKSEVSVPLPPKIPAVPSFGLFGRRREMEIIERCWKAAQGGQRQVLLLAGEPGIGKTRLAMEAGRMVQREGALVLFGACDEDICLPYRSIAEALQHYVLTAPDDILLTHIREHQGELSRIVPAIEQRIPVIAKPQRTNTESERYQLFEAVVGLLALASQRGPILLVLDDLQWAGTPELLLLKHILRAGAELKLLVIATYRDTELHESPLKLALADLNRDANVQQISLQGLDEQGATDFIAAAAGHELNERQLTIARAIRQGTEGSPLFIGEVLRHLSEIGAGLESGGAGPLTPDIEKLGIPRGVKGAIAQRLSRLAASTNQVLRSASVIGREFDLSLLKEIVERTDGDLFDSIEEAEIAGLIARHPGGRNSYFFTHVLVRNALYDEINASRRTHMHERVGTALELLSVRDREQRVDELARHWLAAATNRPTALKAIQFARAAAERALHGLAFEQAAEYYRDALSVLEGDDWDSQLLRCDLTIALSAAQLRSGDPTYRNTVARAIEIARAQGNKHYFARAVLSSARPYHPFTNSNVVDQNLIGLYEEAIAWLGEKGDVTLRAKLNACLAGEMFHTPERERRRELACQAVDMARRCGDRSLQAQALHIYASTINQPKTLAERLALSAEQCALVDELASRESKWAAAYQRMGALLEAADLTGAKEMLERLKDLAGKLRQPFLIWATEHASAMFSILSGSPNAEQEVEAAFRTGIAGGQPEAEQAYFGQLSVIRRDQGRHSELIEPLRSLAEALAHLPVWRVVLAGLYCETDQFEEARQQLRTLASGNFALPSDWTWASTAISLAQVCSDLRETDLASRFYPELQVVAEQVGVTGIGLVCYGSLAFPCAQLAACLRLWDDAEQYFGRAIATNALIGARPYLVRSKRAYADMLLDRNVGGDAARAAALIADAEQEARALGMRRELTRLDRLRCRPMAAA
jgi:class 3 adenylate cyclase